MLKVNRYSTIRGEPVHRPPDGYHLTGWYDNLLKPTTLLVVIGTAIALQYRDTVVRLHAAQLGDAEAELQIWMTVLSLFVGVRLIQSLYLAKRDYLHLRTRLLDVLIFGCVSVVIGGGVLGIVSDNAKWGLGLFVLLALVGCLNHYLLIFYRIPRQSTLYDYPIERRIQIVNMLVCGYCALSLCIALFYITKTDALGVFSRVAVASVCLALALNMLHSQQLTFVPKFLLTNAPDSPAELTRIFKALFWRAAQNRSDDQIEELLYAMAPQPFQAIRTVRANAKDAFSIADAMVSEFGYVFRFVLGTEDETYVRKTVRALLQSAGGFGSFGYLNFYMIEHDNNKVGFVKLDSLESRTVYHSLASFKVFLSLAMRMRPTQLLATCSRWKKVAAAFPQPDVGEVRLAYLVIFRNTAGTVMEKPRQCFS